MRVSRIHFALWAFMAVFAVGLALVAMQRPASAQETTGGMEGLVKDPTGAVIPGATVTVTAPTLVGSKVVTTDSAGYYRFANLPTGTYTLTVKAPGFDTTVRAGLAIEAGHLPTVDLTMKLGSVSTVVSVNALDAPLIDVTTTTTTTTISQDVIQQMPHGTSFQSVIQFSPGARQEPLMGNTTSSTGTGGASPGNGSNGGSFGFSVGGAADNENAYLIEGQETGEVIGGYSHTNVPFDFVQETEMKTSTEAAYGGALGGVVNVVLKKGTANWHGSFSTQFENQNMDGSPNAYSRYDPAGVTLPVAANGTPNDPNYQLYQPKIDHNSDFFPGVTLGGPLFGLVPKALADHISPSLKDRMYVFLGFNPQWIADERLVNFGSPTGVVPFSRNTHTFYSNARVDAEITDKIRVFGSWIYQAQRQSGETMPYADSTAGLYNVSTAQPLDVFAHTYGYSAPNALVNTGADITLTQSLVSTTRLGYFFENYHDNGYPSPSDVWIFENAGVGQSALCPSGTPPASCPAWPSILNQPNGYQTAPLVQESHRNASKHLQFDEDFQWYKSGWAGTHTFKFGYQLNRESNDIFQGNNAPEIQVFPGSTEFYSIQTTGGAACKAEVAAYGAAYGQYSTTTGNLTGCTGTYGYVTVYDTGTGGKAISYNNALFGQDAWTLKHGLTVSVGLRVEKEYLPAESTAGGANPRPINFGWGDKIEPRIGASWDVLGNGKLKLFGAYGVYNDIMKLNLAISSFGGQYWQNCSYLLNDADYTGVAPMFDGSGRYCSGTGEANFGSNGVPSSTNYPFIENANYRANEGAISGLKPYRQHETSTGVDYQFNPTTAFEVRWDRRRLDHAIEDAALYNPNAGGENFEIVNPGEGVDSTWNGYWNFLYGSGGDCNACGPMPKAARSYDGLELRVTKNVGNNWNGMFSYIYSRLRGNYSGLTDSDLADGGGGRISPNNSRAFDEPYFYYTSHGTSANGPLATDRPNTFSGYGSYSLPWSQLHLGKKNTTELGLFQVAYQGSPVSSYIDTGETYGPGSAGAYFVYPEGRGMWTDVSQNTSSGIITVGNTYARRTSWYTQSDVNFKHTYAVKESQSIVFDATLGNVLNEHAITEYNSVIDSNNYGDYITPGGVTLGNATDEAVPYYAFEHPYNWKLLTTQSGMTINSLYGKPLTYQAARTIRLQLHYNF